MSFVAIIPARGGSKGVPRKNLREIGISSLVARAILSCQNAGLEVYVSTDSAEIATEAKNHGAKVITRPDELSGDTASSESAVLHALEQLTFTPEIAFLVQATSPFISPADLVKALDALKDPNTHSVFSGVEDHSFRWWVRNGEWVPAAHSKNHRPRRQELPQTVRETGAFYGFKTSSFINEKTRFCGLSVPIITDSCFSIEIDTFADLELAQVIEPLWRSVNGKLEGNALSKIKGVGYDFDGVMTPNNVVLSETGEESVTVHRGDGMGVRLLDEIGIHQAIFTLEKGEIAPTRARKLSIECYSGTENKLKSLTSWANDEGIGLHEIAYLGNDLNDIEVMNAVGFAVAVQDAVPEVKRVAKLILESKGGDGAVREFSDLLRMARNECKDC